MSRGPGSIASPEMVLLAAVEFLLSFLAFYVLLLPGEAVFGADGVANGLHHDTAQHAVILALAISATSLTIGLYRPEICLQTRRLLVNTVVAGLLAFPAVLLVSVISDIDVGFLFGRDAFWPMKIFLTWIMLLFATRLSFRAALRLGFLSRRVMVIGSARQAARTVQAIATVRKGFFSLVGTVEPSDATMPDVQHLGAQRVWGVVVTGDVRGRVALDYLLALKTAGIRVFGDVEFREQHLRRLDLEQMPPDWLLSAAALACGPVEHAVRRVAEVLISLALLAFTLPLLALAALAIRLDSPGPVLYRQTRVGLNGRPFTLLKMRSMRLDAEAKGPTWAAQRDPRVTRVGSFLRRVRIDELPQLINVLRGEMGFVGPRPERPHFVEQLAEVIPHYRDRAYVKPGVTGWAQVNYPYGASIEDARQKLSYDLYYVKHRSLMLDALIVLATVRVILFQEGAR